MTEMGRGELTFEHAMNDTEGHGTRRFVEEMLGRAQLSEDAAVVVVEPETDRGVVRVTVYGGWTEDCPRARVLTGVVRRALRRLAGP